VGEPDEIHPGAGARHETRTLAHCPPRIVRNFLAYEADRETAIELVRKRVPVSEGELAEAVAEVSGNEFVGPGMRPGDVRRLGRKSDFNEV
jgi:hypothetical protein